MKSPIIGGKRESKAPCSNVALTGPKSEDSTANSTLLASISRQQKALLKREVGRCGKTEVKRNYRNQITHLCNAVKLTNQSGEVISQMTHMRKKGDPGGLLIKAIRRITAAVEVNPLYASPGPSSPGKRGGEAVGLNVSAMVQASNIPRPPNGTMVGLRQRTTEEEVASGTATRAVLAAYAACGVGLKAARRTPDYWSAHTADLMGKASKSVKGKTDVQYWEQLKDAKAHASAHRQEFIKTGSAKSAQLSFFGRALPPAPIPAQVESLSQHEADLTSVFHTGAETLRDATIFAEKWAHKRLATSKRDLKNPEWPTTSSCYEKSASKGGLLKFLLSTCAFAEELPEDIPGYSSCAMVGCLEARFVQYALREMDACAKGGKPPPARVTCISERGVKTRTVTVSPAWTQVLGHAVRGRLFGGLRSEKGTYWPLSGTPDAELIDNFVGGHASKLVSTDLTRATDLLPLDLVGAIVDGLEQSGRLSRLEVRILRLLTGPQLIHQSSDGSGAKRTTRGILMGLPTSWCILSLIHLFWLGKVRDTSRGEEWGRHRYSICGDDALLATTNAGAERYREMVKKCGGEVSLGKHFESAGPRELRGVFLERLYTFTKDDSSLIASGKRVAAIPVKGLSTGNPGRSYTDGAPIVFKSENLAQLICLDGIMVQARNDPGIKAVCEKYIQNACPWLQHYALKVLKLAPGHPLQLGGYPFTERTPEGDALAIQVRDSNANFSLSLKQELDPQWRMASEWSREGRRDAIARGLIFDVTPSTQPLGYDESGPLLRRQVRLPRQSKFGRFTEREHNLTTIVGPFAQLKCFCDRKTEHRVLGTDFAVKQLKKLRARGKADPSGEPLELWDGSKKELFGWLRPVKWLRPGPRPMTSGISKEALSEMIQWAAEYGTIPLTEEWISMSSWTDDLSSHRQGIVDAVTLVWSKAHPEFPWFKPKTSRDRRRRERLKARKLAYSGYSDRMLNFDKSLEGFKKKVHIRYK